LTVDSKRSADLSCRSAAFRRLAQSAALRPRYKTEIRRADKQKAHLDAKLPEDFDKAPAEPITLKKLGAAISAAGEELQLSGHKMAFVGGHAQR
jgi:hypothetical protein